MANLLTFTTGDDVTVVRSDRLDGYHLTINGGTRTLVLVVNGEHILIPGTDANVALALAALRAEVIRG